MEQVLAFAAAQAERETLARVSDAQAWFGNPNRARKALLRLERLGFAFPIAHASYAIPDRARFMDALPRRDPAERLAAWLPAWLRDRRHRKEDLPAGLDWDRACFFGLAVARRTPLRWSGPVLFVPIAAGAEALGKIHQRVPLFAGDLLAPVEQDAAAKAPVPSAADLARVLAVHHDPRLREASLTLAGAGRPALAEAIARTDPPLPFPSEGVRLALGPPFRYRLFAPLSWVTRNITFAHPGR